MIEEPGLYADLDNEDYHAHAEWLSSSVLKTVLPERYTVPNSRKALDAGSVFHTIALEPHRLDGLADELGLVVLDEQEVGVKADGSPSTSPTSTKAWKDAVADAEQSGRTAMRLSEWQGWVDQAKSMAGALRAHPVAGPLLQGDGIVEESAFWVDAAGRKHRARADWRKLGVIVDLKSTVEKPGRWSLRSAVRKYGYHVSAAHYLEVYRGLGVDVDAFALIFVSKSAPHYVTVAEIGPELMDEGYEQRAEALRRLTDPTADAYEGASGFITL